MTKSFQPITSPLPPLSLPDGWRILRKRDDWIVQEAPAAPWYWWLSSLAFIHGLTAAGYSPGSFFTVAQKERGILVIGQETLVQAARRLVAKELSGRSVVRQWIKKWRHTNQRYRLLVSKIRAQSLSNLAEAKLAARFQKFCRLYYEVETLPLCNEFLIPYTDDLFNNEMIKHPEEAETIRQLIIPKKKSFLQIEEEELGRLQKLLGQKRKIALEQHAQKWFFVNAGYDGPHFPTQQELEKRLRNLKSVSASKKEKAAPINLSPKVKTIIKLTRVVAEWKDERKKNNLIGSCVLDDFSREFSRRYKIPYPLLRYAVPRDFIRIIRRDPKLKPELTQRTRSGAAWIISGQKHSDFFANGPAKKIEKFLHAVKRPTAFVKGVTAYPGVVRGRVRIVRHPGQEPFQSGEILLTSMTRPEFVPLMKRAKAVLCDEGGLLSHAAIVARELGIPCLVGLKNAMASFRSGDKVEVDTERGIVHKLG